MNPNKTTFNRIAAVLLSIFAAASIVPAVHGQARTGGGPGGGGPGGVGNFGNFGGNNGTRGGTGNSSSSSSTTGTTSREYPNSTLPGEAVFQMDPETHGIIGMADAATLAQIQTVISNLDRPKPEALIKVVFLEVQHDNALDFGAEGTLNTKKYNLPGVNSSTLASQFGLSQLGITGATIGQTTMPNGQGIYSLTGSDFTATLRAIASASKVEVLSRPSIMVRNNQPATIQVGQSVPLINGVTFPTVASGPVSSVTYQPVGIILQVTPFISKDGLVEMIVSPQISDISSQQVQISSNVFAPVLDMRTASTVVVTPDGQTVVIGGLMENDKTMIDSKIPVLGDIPLLGALFKHRQQALTKKELMIFLTPHIVTMPTQLASATRTEDKSAVLSHQDFGEDELNRFFDRLPAKPGITTSTNKPAGK